MLAALLARADGLTSAELCQLLWGQTDRDTRLHLLVHRTRAALDQPDRLERTPGGYRLRTDVAELDLDDLTDLALSDPRAALAMARLEPLAGCDGELFDTRRSELAERLALARKAALRAALDTGDDDLVLSEISAVRDAAPYDEELALVHLTVLARTGRTADALEEYERMRLYAIRNALATSCSSISSMRRSSRRATSWTLMPDVLSPSSRSAKQMTIILERLTGDSRFRSGRRLRPLRAVSLRPLSSRFVAMSWPAGGGSPRGSVWAGPSRSIRGWQARSKRWKREPQRLRTATGRRPGRPSPLRSPSRLRRRR